MSAKLYSQAPLPVRLSPVLRLGLISGGSCRIRPRLKRAQRTCTPGKKNSTPDALSKSGTASRASAFLRCLRLLRRNVPAQTFKGGLAKKKKKKQGPEGTADQAGRACASVNNNLLLKLPARHCVNNAPCPVLS